MLRVLLIELIYNETPFDNNFLDKYKEILLLYVVIHLLFSQNDLN